MTSYKFVYKEHDEEGHNTLKAVAQTHQFNRWMYDAIKPFLKGEIFEIGSGIGNITQYVMDDGFSITASDIREGYCSTLQNRFQGKPFFAGVKKVDIAHLNFEQEYIQILNKFDCVIALNAIEHIEAHQQALVNCKKLLRENGILIVLVPAFQQLYNGFDVGLHHYRRYTRSTLQQLFKQAGFVINNTSYFNAAGVVGWWFSGRVLKHKILPARQLFIFNKLVPLFRILDMLTLRKIGLSVITVGNKN